MDEQFAGAKADVEHPFCNDANEQRQRDLQCEVESGRRENLSRSVRHYAIISHLRMTQSDTEVYVPVD